MPATTLGQLQSALASAGATNSGNYIEPGASFVNSMNEIGPRVYSLGMWRDLVTEQVYEGMDGYISLDRDIESVMFAAINNIPQRVFAAFHDVSTFGVTTSLPIQCGLIDMNYHTSKRDLTSIQDVDTFEEVTPISTLHLTEEDGTALTLANLDGGDIIVRGRTLEGLKVNGTLVGATTQTITFATPVVFFDEIRGVDLPFIVHVRTDVADVDTNIAEIQRGSDLVRYRRFKVSGNTDSTYVHILVKRSWMTVAETSDIVWLGNISAWKHALLGKLAEDNADIERANYHWQVARQMLEDEKDASRGAAIPKLDLDLVSGSGYAIHSLY